jgi:hypothetical protein
MLFEGGAMTKQIVLVAALLGLTLGAATANEPIHCIGAIGVGDQASGD